MAQDSQLWQGLDKARGTAEAKNGGQSRTSLMEQEPTPLAPGPSLSLPDPTGSPSLPSVFSPPKALGPQPSTRLPLSHQCEVSLCTLKSSFTSVVQMIAFNPHPKGWCPASDLLNAHLGQSCDWGFGPAPLQQRQLVNLEGQRGSCSCQKPKESGSQDAGEHVFVPSLGPPPAPCPC